MSAAESLTAEDLRSRLYHSLREKGLVDALKSQLRNKLVSELRQVSTEQTFQPEPGQSPEGSLLHKASNSLVVDHLKRCRYDYSLSVFMPECATPESQLFSTRDLLQLLNVSPQSRLYKNLTQTTHASHQKGFLWQLLCEIASSCGHSSRDSGVQTDATRMPPPCSLEEQLSKVDSHYSSISDDHKQRWLATEERLLSYQRNLDERSKTEIQLEMARFKENELARMRMEERENNRQEVDKLRREMELTYKTKSEALLERERHSIERLQKEQQISERETYNQRQSLLEEIEAVRQREVNMKRQDELYSREHLLWEEKMKTREQLIKTKEGDLRKADIEYNQRLSDDLKKYKLEEQARLLDRTKDLDYREIKVRENERRLDEELREVQQVKDELREKRKQCHQLEGELQKLNHELITVKTEADLMSGKVREMVDYQIVRDDNILMKRELDGHKTRIAELSRDIMVERQKNEDLLREMTERASKPTPEVYLLQKELDRHRSETKQERAIYEHHKVNMERKLHDEVTRNHELISKYEEQTLQTEEMAREIRDLQRQLGHTKTALTNEVYRKPKPRLSSEIVLLQQRLAHHSYLYRGASPCDLDGGEVDPSLIRTTNDPQLLFSASYGLVDHSVGGGRDPGSVPSLQMPPRTSSDDLNYSMDLVEETKRRLRRLEKEAENLDHHYQNYQYRLMNTNLAESQPVLTSTQAVTAHQGPRSEHTTAAHRPAATNSGHHAGGHPHVTISDQHVAATKGSRPTATQSILRDSSGVRDRPMSSTPHKRQDLAPLPLSPRDPSSHELVRDSSLINTSVSTVQSSSPHRSRDQERTVHHRPLSVDDLDHRPGSPSIVVMAESGPDLRPRSLAPLPTQPAAISLDDAWKQEAASSSQDRESADRESADREARDREAREASERRRRAAEEEERLFEEAQRQKEAARRRREDEAWEAQQRELDRLQGTTPSAPVQESQLSDDSPDPGAEAPTEDIDPTMLRYMQMVQERKVKEKQEANITKKAVDTWNKGKSKEEVEEKSSSVQEDPTSEDKSEVVEVSDGDFW